jgi:poly-beta-hydroxyalkanoate depolymerase
VIGAKDLHVVSVCQPTVPTLGAISLLASAGEEFMKASDNLSTNITEGADNLVTSVNETANGAVEGAMGFADKVSETATDAVNKVGDTVNGSASETPPATTTGGRRGKKK